MYAFRTILLGTGHEIKVSKIKKAYQKQNEGFWLYQCFGWPPWLVRCLVCHPERAGSGPAMAQIDFSVFPKKKHADVQRPQQVHTVFHTLEKAHTFRVVTASKAPKNAYFFNVVQHQYMISGPRFAFLMVHSSIHDTWTNFTFLIYSSMHDT